MFNAQLNIKKHKIIGEQAFTEDNFLIYNLFAYDLPENITVPKIYEYFQTFGAVLDVRLFGRSKSKKCFIHFAEPNVAAKILQERCHVFMDCVIRVKGCHSLHQPDGKNLIKSLESFRRNCSTENADNCSSLNKIDQEALILTLNDDCLEHICKQLCLSDQINFALSCQRFYDVLVMVSKIQHANLNTNILEGWTLLKIRLFLEIVGPQIKVLETSQDIFINYYFETVLKFLGSFCTNVEKLKVAHYGHRSNLIKILIQNMQQLRELELNDIEIKFNLMQHLNTLQSLKSLYISLNSDATYRNIRALTGLEKLSLSGCTNLTSWHLRNICQNLKNLRYLDVSNYKSSKTEDYEHISKNLLHLKTLKLCCAKGDFNCLAQLPNLKSLEIYRNVEPDTIMEGFLSNLAKFRANQLEELKLADLIDTNLKLAASVAKLKKLKVLYCNYRALEDKTLDIFSHLSELEDLFLDDCDFITDEIVLQILKNCLKVKHITLRRSISLTPNFVCNASKLLLEQRSNFLRTCRVQIEINPYKWNFITDYSSDVLKIICVQSFDDYSCSEDSDYNDYYYDDDHNDYGFSDDSDYDYRDPYLDFGDYPEHHWY